MNDVAEKLLALVERRRVLLDEVARIEAAFAMAIANVETPKLLEAAPAAPKTRKPLTGDTLAKKSAELRELEPHFEVLAPAERTIVEARMNGKLPEQIARDLGRTASSVSTTLYLAKKKLLAARESRPSGEKPAAPPASDDEEPPPAPVQTKLRAPRAPRQKREPKEPREVSEPSVTSSKDAVRAVYFNDIKRYTVIRREEELELFALWKATGDPRIADRLVAANLRLVVVIAREYHAKRHDLLDLVQEGSIGLFHALSKFDPTRGIRFTSYASWWIRAYILKFMLANHHLVKIGTTQEQRHLFFNLRKTRALLEKDGATATVEQIAEALGVDAADVSAMEERMNSAITPIDVPILADADAATSRHTEFPADEKWRPDIEMETHDFRSVAKHHIAAFGHTLNPRQKIIFAQRLVAEDPVTLVELAGEMGVTRERVRQIEEKIKARLKTYLRARMRMEDLDLAI